LLVPAGVCTATCRLVLAVNVLLNVAVICVLLTTTRLVTVIPAELNTRLLLPETKFVPVSTTFVLPPSSPTVGKIEASVGTPSAFTVNVAALLVPPAVVTVTFLPPVVAPNAITKLAVIVVLFTTATFVGVTPVPLTPTVAPAVKFVPLNVTGTVVLCVPLDGLTEASVGARIGGRMVRTVWTEELPSVAVIVALT
jgi:hypothetical protein